MLKYRARLATTRDEPSFGRVFAAVWGGILCTVLLVVLTSGGSTWWVVPETMAVLVAVAVIMFELSLLLEDEEDGVHAAPAPAAFPALARSSAAVPTDVPIARGPSAAARTIRHRAAH